jgi:alpha-beta hydrolase superfamily lysophospholipase
MGAPDRGFLAAQRLVDRARQAVFGHSGGGIYALLLASGLAGPAPKVRAVVLLEPVPMRFFDFFSSRRSRRTRLASSRVMSRIRPKQGRSPDRPRAQDPEPWHR